MPYEKLTEQSYQNFHGINNKVSQYNTQLEEVLDMSNLDFDVPGSLKKRPGSTQMITAGVSGRITGIFELQRLTGLSLILFASDSKMYYLQANAAVTFQSGLQNSNFSYVNFVDRTFFANGKNFMKFDGLTYGFGSTILGTLQTNYNSYLYSLPVLNVIGASTLVFNVPASSSWTGIFTYTFGWVNERGFHGPPSNPITVSIAGASVITIDINSLGASLPVPASYGIGLSAIFSYLGVSTYANAALAVYRDSGPGTARFRIGYIGMTTFGATLMTPIFSDNNITQSTFEEPATINATLAPRYLEVFNNQLFMAGFSQALSTVQFSDIGEPESVQPTNNFEVRTNDGDRVSALRSYFSKLYIFKERSFHALSGDDPTNFTLTEISDEYGCLSGRAIVVYDNIMLFLDRKGIVQYNGANVMILSTQIQSIFENMNVDAARDNAVMVHNRPKNQVWCAIPCNGSNVNNCIIVYDYVTKGFTKFDGLNPSSLQMVIGGFGKETPVFGDYQGKIHNFGASLFGDNGAGITCLVQTRFFNQGQQSIQKQFRRLWLNVDAVTGSTSQVDIDFFQDYGASVILSRSIFQNPFQTRIDFGISAKALSVRVKNFSASDSMTLHGVVLASRLQRLV